MSNVVRNLEDQFSTFAALKVETKRSFSKKMRNVAVKSTFTGTDHFQFKFIVIGTYS